MIYLSLSKSIPDVASSRRSNCGCLINARANIMRCFYPPERLLPFSSILPFNPPFDTTKSYAFTFLRHFIIFSSERSNPWLPYLRFSSNVPANKKIYCVTYETIFCMS